jgi:hypothetical protein
MFKMEGQMSLSQEEEKEKMLVDDKRIRDIISRNSIDGTEHVQVDRNFSGLWLLPSFINHSCLPNSNWRKLGSALFIYASKTIKRGEEITVSYFDALVPLSQRQAKCGRWGFECKCRRCILELSLKAALEPITARFEQLHDKALEAANVARSQEPFSVDLPACGEFAKIFGEAEEIIRSSTLLKTEEEKNWIRASFVSAHLAGTLTKDLQDYVPSRGKVLEVIQNTVPGNIRTLIMAAQQLKEANSSIGDESQAFIARHASEQAREACIRVFGRHSEDLLKALILCYSSYRLF